MCIRDSSNTVPVESSHMRSRFRYRPAMVKFPIAGDVKMITYILETSLQMTLVIRLFPHPFGRRVLDTSLLNTNVYDIRRILRQRQIAICLYDQ